MERKTSLAERRNRALQEQIRAHLGEEVIGGNAVRVAVDAAFFDELEVDIDRAIDFIDGVTFIWGKGSVARSVSERLAQAGKRGVKVSWLTDGIAGKGDKANTRRIQSTGGDFRYFRPLGNPFARSHWQTGNVSAPSPFPKRHDYNYRTHRKLVVMNTQEGPVAWVFGHGFNDCWLTGEHGLSARRDLAIRITGPAVARLHRVFLGDWAIAGGAQRRVSYDCPVTGSTELQVIDSIGRGGRKHPSQPKTHGTWDVTESAMTLAMLCANVGPDEQLRLATPYLSPTSAIMSVLDLMAHNGWQAWLHNQLGQPLDIVRPELLINGAHIGPRPPQIAARLAGEALFDRLFSAGFDIRLFEKSMFHSKLALVGNRAVRFGSSNLNMRSLQMDNELDLVICDPVVVAELAGAYDHYAAQARMLTPETWALRTLGQRVGERVVNHTVAAYL